MKCQLDALLSKFFIVFWYISRQIAHHILPTCMAVFLLEYLVVKTETNGHNTGCFFHNIISGARLKNVMIGHEKNKNALVHINTQTLLAWMYAWIRMHWCTLIQTLLAWMYAWIRMHWCTLIQTLLAWMYAWLRMHWYTSIQTLLAWMYAWIRMHWYTSIQTLLAWMYAWLRMHWYTSIQTLLAWMYAWIRTPTYSSTAHLDTLLGQLSETGNHRHACPVAWTWLHQAQRTENGQTRTDRWSLPWSGRKHPGDASSRHSAQNGCVHCWWHKPRRYHLRNEDLSSCEIEKLMFHNEVETRYSLYHKFANHAINKMFIISNILFRIPLKNFWI